MDANLKKEYNKARMALIADITRRPGEEAARFEAVRAIVNYVDYLEGYKEEPSVGHAPALIHLNEPPASNNNEDDERIDKFVQMMAMGKREKAAKG